MNFSWKKNYMKLRYYNMEKRGRDAGYYVKNKEKVKERKKR